MAGVGDRKGLDRLPRCAVVAVVAAGDRPPPPEIVLRWHRAGFQLFWRRRSRRRGASSLPPATIDLIREMAAPGRLWGAERIRGELLKG